MLVGYARSSTAKQIAGYESQLEELKALGCEKVFREQVSSVGERDQLEAALEFVREGDSFVVTKLDRLARSTKHLLEIVERLKSKGVSLRILNLNLDSATPTGKLLLTMVASIATFEREMMLERQRDGIERAKREGKYKGRTPTAKAKTAQIIEMRNNGVGPTAIARKLEIGRTSVFRILKDNARFVSKAAGGQA